MISKLVIIFTTMVNGGTIGALENPEIITCKVTNHDMELIQDMECSSVDSLKPWNMVVNSKYESGTFWNADWPGGKVGIEFSGKDHSVAYENEELDIVFLGSVWAYNLKGESL